MVNLAKRDNVMVLGLGKTGYSVVVFLMEVLGQRCQVLDSREAPPYLEDCRRNYPSVEIVLGAFDGSKLKQASEIIVSPGISLKCPAIAEAIAAGVSVIGDVELFLRYCGGRVIGITGSNGKSTVTMLLGQICEASGYDVKVGGNIGTPALSLLDDLDGRPETLFILELSSFQLEAIQKPCLYVACLLNVSADHMDRYESVQEYQHAKQRIFLGAKHIVYNLDDALTMPVDEQCSRNRYGYTLAKQELEEEKQYYFDPLRRAIMVLNDSQTLLQIEDLNIKGLHNIANVMAAFIIADILRIDRMMTAYAVKNFTGLPHRCQVVLTHQGITYINDSKATNVGATEAAINGIKDEYKPICLILGGQAKDADFDDLGEIINNYVDEVVLIGVDRERIRVKIASSVSVHDADNMLSAVKIARDHCRHGGLVMLSPACASFDMYQNYEERGEQFVKSVYALCA